jgi:hypothetical protein
MGNIRVADVPAAASPANESGLGAKKTDQERGRFLIGLWISAILPVVGHHPGTKVSEMA